MFLATLVSRIFDPPVVIIVLTVLAVRLSNLPPSDLVRIALIIPVLISIPLILFIWKLKKREISNWDITNRKERIKPLIILLGFLLVDSIIISFFQNALLNSYFMLLFFWVLGFLLITLFWKISAHTGVLTLAVSLLLLWYGTGMWPFILTIFLVSWARTVRRDHTLLQVAAGIIYSIALFGFWNLVIK